MSGETAIATFCGTLGLPLPTAGVSLPFALQLERSGTFRMEEDRAGGYWLTLARPVPAYHGGVALAALRAVHPDRALPIRVKAGFHGEETLVLMTRLAAQATDAPSIEAALRILVRLADAVEAGQ